MDAFKITSNRNVYIFDIPLCFSNRLASWIPSILADGLSKSIKDDLKLRCDLFIWPAKKLTT